MILDVVSGDQCVCQTAEGRYLEGIYLSWFLNSCMQVSQLYIHIYMAEVPLVVLSVYVFMCSAIIFLSECLSIVLFYYHLYR